MRLIRVRHRSGFANSLRGHGMRDAVLFALENACMYVRVCVCVCVGSKKTPRQVVNNMLFFTWAALFATPLAQLTTFASNQGAVDGTFCYSMHNLCTQSGSFGRHFLRPLAQFITFAHNQGPLDATFRGTSRSIREALEVPMDRRNHKMHCKLQWIGIHCEL